MNIALNITKTESKDNNQYTELLLAFLLFYNYMISAFNLTVRHFIGNIYKIDTLIMYAIFMLVVVLSIKSVLKNIRVEQITFILFIIITIFVSYLFSSDISVNNEVAQKIFLVCVPAFIVSSITSDYKKLWKYMLYGSYFAVSSITYLTFVLKYESFITGGSYSQSNAYSLLLPCSVLLISIFEKFDIKNLIVLSLGFFIMLMNGARGPLFCIVILLLLLIIRSIIKLSNTEKYLLIGMSIIAFSSIVVLFDKIINFLYGLFIKYNMSTRVLDRFINNSFFEDNARKKLIEASFASINQNFVFGLGAINDRQFLNEKVLFEQNAIGSYPHNIIFEFLMQYGVFIGSAFLIALMALFYKTYKRIRNDNYPLNTFLTFTTIGFVPLFVSGSYIDDSNFYILIGFCFGLLSKKYYARKVLN